jgi:ketosteroid isomerase-like protein
MQRAIDEADIRRRIEKLVEAIRAMDLEGVKSIYAPDIVSFDVVPPLQHVGAEAQWKNWADVFAAYQRPLGYEVRDLTITVGGDVAFGHSLNRISGTLKSGQSSGVLGSVDALLSEDRRQLANRTPPGLGAFRCGDRQGGTES